MATRKVRYKKLNVKTALPVLCEDEVDPSEYEALTTETQIATGVDEGEKNEYHLQIALQGATTTAVVKEIPVPPPMESDINYEELYAQTYVQPVNYIRFSQTVEECIGCNYDMTEEDDEFLKGYNQNRPANAQLSEDHFEYIMEVYEDTASITTPFAAVDKTIVPYDHMMAGLTELQIPKLMNYAKEIYEYWKQRRTDIGGPLHPSLKFETHQETDDSDPFVCFRRREVRQTRKTRARDMQSADKLKKLRREIEDGRQLVLLSHQREVSKRDMLHTDRAIYEQRAKLKEMKIRLGIKIDDEDLVNQKPQKKKVSDLVLAQRNGSGAAARPAQRESRSAETDLVQLAESLLEKEAELRVDVIKRIENHRRWNEGHLDMTCEPLLPVENHSAGGGFRTAKVQLPMTPPASASSYEDEDEPEPMELDAPPASAFAVFEFKGAAPSSGNAAGQAMPVHQFRRRIGRLNRLWIDRRRVMASPPPEPFGGHRRANDAMDADMTVSDRWKYDCDDSDEEEQHVYEYDPYDIPALKFRASLPLPFPIPGRRPELMAGPGGRSNAAMQAAVRHAIQQRPSGSGAGSASAATPSAVADAAGSAAPQKQS